MKTEGRGAPKNGDAARNTLKPWLAKAITLPQAERIAMATFPDRSSSLQRIAPLCEAINQLVGLIYSPLPTSDLPSADKLIPHLKRLRNELSPINVSYLKLIGWSHQRAANLPAGRRESAPNHVDHTVEGLVRAINDILTWVSTPAANADKIEHSLAPAVPAKAFIEILPELFESVFGEKFGRGDTGPGMRFAIAVLRETGLRSESDSDDSIASMVKKALQRATKPSTSNDIADT